MMGFLLFIGGSSLVFIGAYFLKSYKQNGIHSSESLLITNAIELAYLHKGINHAYKIFLMNLIVRGYLQPSKMKTKFRFNNVDYSLDNTSPYSDEVYSVMRKKCLRGSREFECYELIYDKELKASLANSLKEVHKHLEERGLIIPSVIVNNIHFYKFLGILSLTTIAGYSLLLSSSFFVFIVVLLSCCGLCYFLLAYLGADWLSVKGEEEINRIVGEYELLDDKTDLNIYMMFLASTNEEVLKRKFWYLYQ